MDRVLGTFQLKPWSLGIGHWKLDIIENYSRIAFYYLNTQ